MLVGVDSACRSGAAVVGVAVEAAGDDSGDVVGCAVLGVAPDVVDEPLPVR